MHPLSYLCFRLLGAALPLLSKEQLQLVMQGDLIRHYGEHMVTAKVSAAPAAQPCAKGPSNWAASCQGEGRDQPASGKEGCSWCQWSCLGWAHTAAPGRKGWGPGCPPPLGRVSCLRANPHPSIFPYEPRVAGSALLPPGRSAQASTASNLSRPSSTPRWC